MTLEEEMKKRILYIGLILLIIGVIYNSTVSYEKNPNYHFQVYEIVASTNFFDDSNLADFKLAVKPVFTDRDLVSYNWANHTFQFKSFYHNKASKIRKLGDELRAFIVVADGERIYIGGFYNLNNSPNIFLTTNQNEGKFEYKGENGFDKRNDDRIHKALKNAGILVE